MSSPSMAVAASSSFTTPTVQKYDIFISFRGADTRNNFLSYLRDALDRAIIKTFIDDNIRRGDDVPVTLLETIKVSKIFIVIFSENYAASRWCLNELVQIMECNEENAQTVIPVFFKVDPTHVRHQTGCFARALARHGDHPMIQRWRDALTKAANLSGWDSHVTRPEALLVQSIVSDIISKLYNTSVRTFDNLVGMGSRIAKIWKILGTISKEVHIIGFWGMGGIGKSTLAEAFFNHFSSQFEGQYMIQHFRETCERLGLNELLERLVRGLLNDNNINKGTPSLKNSFIWERLHRMKALIVLDDVNDYRHIKFLTDRRDCLGQGSVVIITSRDKQTLKNVVDEIYEVPELDDDEALCLFARHAFKQEYPSDDHRMKLSTRALHFANGNPLALEILGCYLYGRSNEEQESALSKLERTPNMDIQRVLRISYDGLDNEEKQIFLNIACLLNWETIDIVKHFHDSCGYFTDTGIRVLIDKSLITVNDNTVRMHDLLQEMGKEIVRQECIKEPGKRSRLFDYDDISLALSMNKGTEVIEGIRLNMFGERSFNINPATFERMCNLKFLKIYSHIFIEFKVGLLPQALGYFSNELRYLHWDWYPLTYFPTNLHLENLVVLRLRHSNIKRLWSGRQNLPHLQTIDLCWCENLIEIPDLSMATNLRILDLSRCFTIKKFPEISMKIEYLYLCDTGIEEVPSSIYCLTSLKALVITLSPLYPRVNIHQRELTASLGCLIALTHLHLRNSDFLKIPVSIKQLTNLELLKLRYCKRLQSLPQLPMNVKRIDAWECVSLEEVASPLTTSIKGEFDSVKEGRIDFDFFGCLKLNQNGKNSILTDVEFKLLHWEKAKEARIQFMGDDIPDWFKYKSLGSSLIAKLPEYWCNSELFCLAFGVVLESKVPYDSVQHIEVAYDYHIRNNIGNWSSAKSTFMDMHWKIEGSIQSNCVELLYNRSSMIDEWRMITKETDDAAVISIEFHVRSLRSWKVKKCGIHLLYRYEIEDSYHTSRIDSDSLSGSTQFLNLGCMEEDMEETMIGDADGDGSSNDNCYNKNNLVEFSAAVPIETNSTRGCFWCFNWFSSFFSAIFLFDARE